jgi:hypothetical protein
MNTLTTIDAQVPYAGRAERTEYGLLRDVVNQIAKQEKWLGAKVRPAYAKNLTNFGNQLILSIYDTTEGSTESREVYVAREVSDMIRDKSRPFESVMDLMVIEHTNKIDGVTVEGAVAYPLCVRPGSANQNIEALEAFAIDTKAKSFSWEDSSPEVKIDDYISLGV